MDFFITIFLSIGFMLGLLCGYFIYTNDTNSNNYCEPSVKSLESELRYAFDAHDKCLNMLGKDKIKITEMFESCAKK